MKKIAILAVLGLLAYSCSNPDVDNAVELGETYTISANLQETRVYIQDNGANFSHLWKTGDHISIINSDALTTANDYTLATGDGQASATFTGSVAPTSTFYAIYPHNASNQITDGKYSVTYPAAQSLLEGTYDPNANVYVAEGSVSAMSFVPTTAYLQISLYSSSAGTEVSKIDISTISGEKIAGAGLVTVAAGVASVVMDGGAGNTITLTAASPIEIETGSDSTSFFIAVPAIAYDGSFEGYQIKIYSGTGASETYQWRNIGSALTPNYVRKMPRLLYDPIDKGTAAVLLSGGSFCKAVKKLADPANSAAYDESLNTSCTAISKIVFVTNKNLTGITGVDLSSAGNGSIKGTYTESDKTVTIQTASDSFAANTSCASMFRYMTVLTEIEGLDSVDFSSTTNLAYMFYKTALRNIDLSGANLSAVINTRMTFYECNSLESVDFGTNSFSLDTSVADLFYNCSSLPSMDLSGFDLREVINARYMFYGCSSLSSITFGPKCTFAKDTSMSNMFRGCTSLTSLDLSYLNTAVVSSARYAFEGCSKLTSITFGENCTFPVCIDYTCMFRDCDKLESLNLTSFGTTEADGSYRKCTSMFEGCSALASVQFKTDNTFALRYVTRTEKMFKGCSNLVSLDIRGIRRGASTGSAAEMFSGCSKLKSITFGSNLSYANNTSSMFEGCSALTTINVRTNSGSLTTATLSRTKDMSRMFYGCTSLTAIPSRLTLSSNVVTTIDHMFDGGGFTSLNCSIFDSTALVSADGFADNCSELTAITFGENFTGASLTSSNFMSANPSRSLTITCKTALKDKLLTLQPALSGYSNLSWTTN